MKTFSAFEDLRYLCNLLNVYQETIWYCCGKVFMCKKKLAIYCNIIIINVRVVIVIIMKQYSQINFLMLDTFLSLFFKRGCDFHL